MDKHYKHIYNQNLIGSKSSVHNNNSFREIRAFEQARININKKENIKKIIYLTNKFLEDIGLKSIKKPRVDLAVEFEKNPNEFYKGIKNSHNLKSIGDIVWMKFTTDGYLGVVAVSNDINFQIPKDKAEFDIKEKGVWKYNTSGILVKKVEKNWDTSFILLFPLSDIPNGLSRSDIECGIGNYLIDNGVPIIDYYSHRF